MLMLVGVPRRSGLVGVRLVRQLTILVSTILSRIVVI